MQNMSYMQDYKRTLNPLQNYYSNAGGDPKGAQIKKVKSSENISAVKPEAAKKQFIEPGSPCDHFEEPLSTTCVTENGINTYFVAKALRGPLLSHASQECKKKQPAKKPSRPIPDLPRAIGGSLAPHLDAYAAITHEGLYRQTNEDKITIYLEENAKWFGVYDGHGGPKCSQFLKDKLHEHFFRLDWRKDVPSALRRAFIEADAEWRKKGDNSGSCALVLLVHNNLCFAANLGDSRAILASDSFRKCYQVSKDHKPSNPDEQKRILEAGGKIYQTTAITEMPDGFYDTITGPLRVFPGRLATTRTFGDFEAKDAKDRIIINEPEITSFEVDEHDFIVMASDGLWDKFDNTEAVEIMRQAYEKEEHGEKGEKGQNGEKGERGERWQGRGAEALLLEAMARGSTDNISLIVVGLNDPSEVREPRKGNEHIKILSSISSHMRKKVSASSNKENDYPEKLKEIDSKILEINRNATRILQQSRR